MTLLIDLAALVVVALAAHRGWRLGASRVLARLAGVVTGLLVGLWLAGHLISDRLSPVLHLLLGLAVLLGCSVVGGRLGSALAGAVVRRPVPASPGAGSIDRAAGAVLRGGIAAGVCSLLLGLIAGFAPATWSSAARNSAVASALDPAGSAIRAVGSGALRVAPADIAALVPAAAATPPSQATADAAAARIRTSVVEVVSQNCGQGVQGTGFVVGNGLVVTNAHVVRGTDDVGVVTDDGARSGAVVVAFAPGSDLAVLYVGGLGTDRAAALTLAADAANGTQGVIVGYPMGERTTTPAAVIERLPLPGSQSVALHEAYVIDAPVRHGNSGSPLLDLQGRVIGVVNALSTTDANDGYATTVSELRRVLATSNGATSPVPTGTCVTEKGTS